VSKQCLTPNKFYPLLNGDAPTVTKQLSNFTSVPYSDSDYFIITYNSPLKIDTVLIPISPLSDSSFKILTLLAQIDSSN